MSNFIHSSSAMNSPKKPFPSFREYKDDILQFNTEIYLKNKMETNNIEMISNFLEIYKKIEEEDLKKPIFSQTTKFKKFPNHLKYYKYIKFSREEEAKKKWTVQKPVSEVEKIVLFLKSQFNKICEENFDQITREFIQEFETYDHPDLFEILANELYNKCIQDSKYRRYYIQLFNQIWINQMIHQQRFEVIDLEGDFYVKFKYIEKDYGMDTLNEEKMMGPFTSLQEAQHEAYKLMNFKRYFIQFLENKFMNRDISFVKEQCDDSVFFEKKRQILGLVDIMLILFDEKVIHMDILHIMILHFLHLNNKNFESIYEIEFESVYNIIKFFYEHSYIQKVKYPIFDHYVSIFDDFKKTQEVTKRMEYFIQEMSMMIENPESVHRKVVKQMTEKEILVQLKKMIQEENRNGFAEIVSKYIRDENREKLMESIFMYLMERKEIKNVMIEMFEEMGSIEMEKVILKKVIDQIGEIQIDIPNITKRLLKGLESMNRLGDRMEYKKMIYGYLENAMNSSQEDWEKECDDSSDEDESFRRF